MGRGGAAWGGPVHRPICILRAQKSRQGMGRCLPAHGAFRRARAASSGPSAPPEIEAHACTHPPAVPAHAAPSCVSAAEQGHPSAPATAPSPAPGAGTAEVAGRCPAQGRSGCCAPRLAGGDLAGQVGRSEPSVFGCWALTAEGLHLATTVGRPFPSRDWRGPL